MVSLFYFLALFSDVYSCSLYSLIALFWHNLCEKYFVISLFRLNRAICSQLISINRFNKLILYV